MSKEAPLVIHSKYDATLIKQTLDDLVVATVSEAYTEDATGLAVTTVLGVGSVVLAVAAQFWVPFPAQRLTLILVIGLNLLLTLLLHLYAHFTGGNDTLYMSRASKFRPHAILVASHMDRFSIDYQLSISSRTHPSIKETLSLGANAWIRQDGTVEKGEFVGHVRRLLHALETTLIQKKS